MSKVLLSTAVYPLPFTDPFHSSWTDGVEQRWCRNQDIFTPHGHMHGVGPALISQNISVPSVFLEYPDWDGFEKEVRKNYDYVGLSLYPHHLEVGFEMCKMVRRLSPKSKIIIGCYGAMGVAEAFDSDEERKKLVDYVCFGDGVRFFRELLGDPVEAPVEQRFMPACASALPWIDPHPRGQMAPVVAGLGCPSGCDFCSTTVYHQGKRIQFADPQKIFQEMKRNYRYRRGDLSMGIFLYDEDFTKYRDQVMELAELIQNDTEFGLSKMQYFCNSSIESLSQYTWDELALSGMTTTFVGVESKFAVEEGYNKRRGRSLEEMFRNLNRIGITTTTGWICGFDFQDKRNIWEDIDYHVSLEPTASQLTRLSVFPGTVLHDKMKEEGRVYEHTTFKDYTFYGDEGGIIHKHFKPHEIDEIIDYGYTKLYETWGPTLARTFKLSLNGYEYCRASKHKLLREDRAEFYRKRCTQQYPMLKACEYFAPNHRVRARIKRLEQRYREHFGEPTRGQKFFSYYVLEKAIAEKVRNFFNPRDRRPKEEPFKKYTFFGNTKPLREEEYPCKVEYPVRNFRYSLHKMYKPVRLITLGLTMKLLELGSGKKAEPVAAEESSAGTC